MTLPSADLDVTGSSHGRISRFSSQAAVIFLSLHIPSQWFVCKYIYFSLLISIDNASWRVLENHASCLPAERSAEGNIEEN